MTGPYERELATIVAATLEADREDAPRLLAIARVLRQDADLRYEQAAEYLEALAARKTRRLQQCERIAESGLLDDTAVLPLTEELLSAPCEHGTDGALVDPSVCSACVAETGD